MYEVLYHPAVVREDIPSLDAAAKRRIKKAIEQKLTTDPEAFGKPLRRSLKGYRKLRVGDYRVVFRVTGSTVYILAILHRAVVYNAAEKRNRAES
jgi:mRNA interferase RelE/StbE